MRGHISALTRIKDAVKGSAGGGYRGAAPAPAPGGLRPGQLAQTWNSETCPAGQPVLAVKFSRTYR
jgi:hypothetical protein